MPLLHQKQGRIGQNSSRESPLKTKKELHVMQGGASVEQSLLAKKLQVLDDG